MYTIAFFLKNQSSLKSIILKEIPTNVSYIILDNEINFIDNYSAIINNEKIFFDYLIFENMNLPKNMLFEKENKKAITNYFMQTNIENLFAIGEASNCEVSINEQLQRIFEYIINGD